MADSKITDLSDGATVQSTDEFVVARSGANKKIAGNHVPGFQLDYVEKTSAVTVSGSSGTPTAVIDGNAITLDGSTKIRIEYFSALAVAGSQALIIMLYDGSTAIARLAQWSANGNGPVLCAYEYTPSAASHTYHIKAWINGGTNGTLEATSGTFVPMFYRVTTV